MGIVQAVPGARRQVDHVALGALVLRPEGMQDPAAFEDVADLLQLLLQ